VSQSDTYINKVTATHEPDGTTLHLCGCVSIECDVECQMYEKAFWCPDCEEFWTVDECWHDKDTKWEVEKPACQTNFIELVAGKDEIITKLEQEIKDQKGKLFLKVEMIEKLDARRIELEETIIAHELESEELDKMRQRLDYELAGQKKLVQGYNGIMEELHKMYGADNEILNEMEARILDEAE